MKKIGFIKPNYPGEKRVALLPNHVTDYLADRIVIEEGFGEYLDIGDSDYINAGCKVLSRQDIFKMCDAIFSLKLIQEPDYSSLRERQLIIGWTHPNGSGHEFMKEVAIPKSLVVVDLDNIVPKVYYKEKSIIDWLKRDFIYKNSFNAGYAATIHAFLSYGMMPSSKTKIAILSSGNVAQGSFAAASKFGADIRMFYRKTMHEFYDSINEYDVIINGIEVDNDSHIISKNQLKCCKKGCLFVDAAADAGNAIEGTYYTSIDNPIYKEDDLYFYEVNNAPSIIHRTSSYDISESFSKWIYGVDIDRYYELARKIGY